MHIKRDIGLFGGYLGLFLGYIGFVFGKVAQQLLQKASLLDSIHCIIVLQCVAMCCGVMQCVAISS